MSRYFKKTIYFRDDIIFMARLDDNEVLFVSDDGIEVTEDPTEEYGDIVYLMDNGYTETNKQEFKEFLKQTKIYGRLTEIRDLT